MALYLEGKPSVDTNELSPKEATRMSHDVIYRNGRAQGSHCDRRPE
jgi:hypothetical protein